MTTIEGGEPSKPAGRPRRFGRGRVNCTVRFSPERYATLKAAAAATGRSVSEQVEFLIEDRERFVEIVGDLVASNADMRETTDQFIKRLEQVEVKQENERAALRKKELENAQRVADRLQKELTSQNERIAEIVAIAVAKALGKGRP